MAEQAEQVHALILCKLHSQVLQPYQNQTASSTPEYIMLSNTHVLSNTHCMCLLIPQTLLDMYSQELDEAKVVLDHQVTRSKTPLGPLLNKNMPKVAGSLKWSQQLRGRVAGGMERLKMLDKECVL